MVSLFYKSPLSLIYINIYYKPEYVIPGLMIENTGFVWDTLQCLHLQPLLFMPLSRPILFVNVFVVVLCALPVLACAVLCSFLLVAVVDVPCPYILCFVWSWLSVFLPFPSLPFLDFYCGPSHSFVWFFSGFGCLQSLLFLCFGLVCVFLCPFMLCVFGVFWWVSDFNSEQMIYCKNR